MNQQGEVLISPFGAPDPPMEQLILSNYNWHLPKKGYENFWDFSQLNALAILGNNPVEFLNSVSLR